MFKICCWTCPHVTVVRDEVHVTREGGEEHQGVGGPGHGPGHQHHHAGSPESPLRLGTTSQY